MLRVAPLCASKGFRAGVAARPARAAWAGEQVVMRVLARCLLASLAVAMAGPAAAQNAHWFCAVKPPSFAATAANRLSCAEFDRLHAAHDIVYQRRDPRSRSCDLRYTIPAARGDGSFTQRCEVRCQSHRDFVGHDWIACPVATDRQRPGARTTGLGSCRDGVVCFKALNFGNEAESCGSFHRQGGSYAYVWVSGVRSCLEGDVGFVPK